MIYKNINDYEQLYLINECDEEANSIMYEKYKPIIYSLAYKHYRRVQNYSVDIEELVQEGYIGLSNAIKGYKDNVNANFYTFATICIERSIQSFCKKYETIKQRNLNNKIPIDSDSDDKFILELREDETTDKNPTAYLEKNYYNELFIKFKHSLSERASMIFELRYNGFNNKEICSLLDISSSMLEKSVREIKKKGVNYLNN